MANRTKDNFLAMLSHELRTPLTPVVSFLDLLEAEPEKSETVRTALATIRRNIDLERRLIDDLLDLTRVARGKMALELKSIDAHEAITQVVEICGPEAVEKQLQVELDLRATKTWIAADAAKFQQIIWNLFKNAIKFTPEKGRIAIASANEEPGRLRIDVRDNGIGIEEDAIGRVFNAFEQGDQSFQQRHGGLGLGLAISRALADAHGGSLVALSEGRGRGATFRLTIKTIEPERAPARRAAETGKTAVRTLRILLVDDHVDTCAALERLLARRGHRIVAVHDVRSALEAVEQDAFDLVISDVGLPDGTGMELMSRLREVRSLRGIAISGFGMNGDLEKSLEAGFSAHLTKPVSFEKLENAIEEAMEEKGRKAEC
jgi:CheY-like chemotaxis protein/two-component sensor histidine kinase